MTPKPPATRSSVAVRLLYHQATGLLSFPDGRAWQGYAGNGQYKNRPEADHLKGHGPIPKGVYVLGNPRSGHTGPYSIPLIPQPGNVMHGRGDFLIHGDSIEHPGKASDGCIIIARLGREAAVRSGLMLEVVA